METSFATFLKDPRCLDRDVLRLDDLEKIQAANRRYEFEERAAILEYDAGFSRAEADRRASREIIGRYGL
jgi:hypothetical protein